MWESTYRCPGASGPAGASVVPPSPSLLLPAGPSPLPSPRTALRLQPPSSLQPAPGLAQQNRRWGRECSQGLLSSGPEPRNGLYPVRTCWFLNPEFMRICVNSRWAHSPKGVVPSLPQSHTHLHMLTLTHIQLTRSLSQVCTFPPAHTHAHSHLCTCSH